MGKRTMSMNRRNFLGSSASAVIVGGTMASGKVYGANDRINIAVAGLNGRGKSHLGGYAAVKDAEVTTICDVDSSLFKPRVEEFFTKRKRPEPKVETDIRKVLEDKSIDAVSLATPNHWHSLGAIWACQAGKDVYVEKPISHNVFEGRKLAEAAAKYECVVQHGTQIRSNPSIREAIDLLHQGILGEVYMARGLCYRWRGDIGKGKPGTPPAHLDWPLWQGPVEDRPFIVDENGKGLLVHYNWHWVWDYGNGDIGNQGVHQLDVARWGLGVEHPYKVASMGGMFLWDDAKTVYNVTSSSFMFKGPDGKDKMMTFEVRPWATNDEMNAKVGILFYGEKGYLVIDSYSHYAFYDKDDKMVKEGKQGASHYQNFIDVVRSRKMDELNAPAEEGHLSSALAHYGLASARLDRVLKIDPETEMAIDDDEANAMLTRKYRKGFEVPEVV
ncbi:MAG: Gfo/Idh/MocA family oxidoreductase [bacterium]|nr:Gfo/Idh/MocA family oxidoreductase [bacterium]